MSRVVGLRADKVRIPFRRAFLTSSGLWLEREAWILTLLSDSGRRGFGEAVLEPRDGETAQAVLDQLVREAGNGPDYLPPGVARRAREQLARIVGTSR